LCALAGLVGVACARAAWAQDYTVPREHEPLSQGWSTLSGETLGASSTAAFVQGGFPGLTVGALHGLASWLDLGGQFSLSYALEGSTQTFVPGIKAQAVLRAKLFDNGRYNLGLRFSPGPLFAFLGAQCVQGVCYQNGLTVVGIALPVELTLGIPVGSAIMLNASLSVPFFAMFPPGGQAVVPILVGGGAEYFIRREVSVSFLTRIGPAISSAGSYFELEALLGASYRF
jgi:opacity protein-like surface antigen